MLPPSGKIQGMMTGHWELNERGLSMVIDRDEFEAEVRRAMEWQFEFDRQVESLRVRYDALPRWRQAIYRWFGIGLGLDATGYIKTKVLASTQATASP